ncbi:hypothetical protein F7725_027634 [Dissostichus mawsoni]|uniref:Uncharacterized protein n=1 Tax=Dissostichus mawsoni TaxID=36200 RepID=A0A7J5XDF8_DISMA|nr:hypothetical protein F7725_027634 [Dissostichus mawsoni]
MELGCGEGGTSRRAVWRPGALRVFLCSWGERERQLGQRRVRGEESTLRKALHYLKGKRSREANDGRGRWRRKGTEDEGRAMTGEEEMGLDACDTSLFDPLHLQNGARQASFTLIRLLPDLLDSPESVCLRSVCVSGVSYCKTPTYRFFNSSPPASHFSSSRHLDSISAEITDDTGSHKHRSPKRASSLASTRIPRGVKRSQAGALKRV